MSVEINVERKAIEIKWDPSDYEGNVKVVATGETGDLHNTSDMPNDGKAALSYPADFSGTSSIQIIGVDDDQVVDEGEIEIG
jgi:hypothetical protein